MDNTFAFVLAMALGKTLGEILQMDIREFYWWQEFYKLAPFDDFSRYHNYHTLMLSSLSGMDTKESLKAVAGVDMSDAEAENQADEEMMSFFGGK